MSSNCVTAGSSSDLRVAAFSIALFDYLQTLPGEYRFYRRHWETRRASLILFLFIGVRYMGAAALITNAIGFYTRNLFTPSQCAHFHLTVPVTKMLASTFANGVIFQRTVVIAGFNRWVAWSLGLLLLAAFPVQVFANVYGRKPLMDKGSCTSSSATLSYNPLLLYNILNICLDGIAVLLATYFLIKNNYGTMTMQGLSKHLLTSGLLYMIGTCVANLLVYFSLAGIGHLNIGSTLTIAVTMILATHLVLDIQDFHAKNSTRGLPSSTGPESMKVSADPHMGLRRRTTPHDTFDSREISMAAAHEETNGTTRSTTTVNGRPGADYELHIIPNINQLSPTNSIDKRRSQSEGEIEKGQMRNNDEYGRAI